MLLLYPGMEPVSVMAHLMYKHRPDDIHWYFGIPEPTGHPDKGLGCVLRVNADRPELRARSAPELHPYRIVFRYIGKICLPNVL